MIWDEIKSSNVTILILIDGFLQYKDEDYYCPIDIVTILILIDGFLQWCFIMIYRLPRSKSQSLF